MNESPNWAEYIICADGNLHVTAVVDEERIISCPFVAGEVKLRLIGQEISLPFLQESDDSIITVQRVETFS